MPKLRLESSSFIARRREFKAARCRTHAADILSSRARYSLCESTLLCPAWPINAADGPRLSVPGIACPCRGSFGNSSQQSPRGCLAPGPRVQLSHGNFSWHVAGLFFFFLAFGQNPPISLRQKGCEHREEQGSEEQPSCRTGGRLEQ